MAERAKTVTPLRTFGDNAHIVVWSGLTQATSDTGSPFEGVGSSDRSVQVMGVFGASGSLVIEGSNDGVNYSALTDPQGNPLVFTAAKIEAITEIVAYIRPRVTNGDGSTDLTVTVLARRNVA